MWTLEFLKDHTLLLGHSFWVWKERTVGTAMNHDCYQVGCILHSNVVHETALPWALNMVVNLPVPFQRRGSRCLFLGLAVVET